MLKVTLLACSAAVLSAAALPQAIPFDPESSSGLVVVYTRVAPGPKVPEPHVTFIPYDPVTRLVETAKNDLPGKAFKVGRGAGMWSNADRQKWQGWAVVVEPGIYVAAEARNPNVGGDTNSYALGTLMFEVKPGKAVYVGDYSFHLGDWKPPTLGQVAGDFLKGIFTLGFVLPKQSVYSVDVTHDDARALAYLRTRIDRDLPLETAEIRYVDFSGIGHPSRAYYVNPIR